MGEGDRRPPEQQFSVLFEGAPYGVIAVNSDGLITMVNSQAARIFGYSAGELIGQSVEILVPERFRRRHIGLRERFADAPQVRLMGTGRELFGLRKGGSEFPLEIGLNQAATSIRDVIIATVVDITERKRVEKLDNVLEEARAKVDMCQELGLPAAILRHDGHVLFVNSLLKELQPQIVFKADRIEISNGPANKLLMQGVASLKSSRPNHKIGPILIPAEGAREALIGRIVRIEIDGNLGILIVTPIGAPQPPSVDLLKSIFGLTSAEARVAALIASGYSLQQLAERLHISIETARTELKQVYAKVGVSRQAELAAMLAAFFMQ
jgi:PAS domain S-box-containing protein